MFSTNQIFKISGPPSQLKDTLEFALKHSGWQEAFTRNNNPVSMAYQITKNGIYCLGRGRLKNEDETHIKEGWSEFPFDYNTDAIARIITQWIDTQPEPYSEFRHCDGGKRIGFICEPAKQMNKDLRDAIQNWERCVITFRPFLCWYAK